VQVSRFYPVRVSDLAAPGGRRSRGAGLRYIKIADDIDAKIRSGELPPGTRLRGERELAVHYKAAIMTYRQAIKVLRERNLVETFHGDGTYVKDEIPDPPDQEKPRGS
jgi:GntR family transcriptional regulator